MFSALPGYEPSVGGSAEPPTAVKLLMHFDGPAGSQTFVDSAGGLVFTADDANQTIQPAQAIFGSGGLDLPTINGISATWPPYLSLASKFTIELIWNTGASISGAQRLVSANNGPYPYNDQSLFLTVDAGVLIWYAGRYGYTDTKYAFPEFTFAPNSTYRIAISRDSSNVLRVFVNGVVSATTYTTTIDWTHVGRPLQIGSSHNYPPSYDQFPGNIPVNGIDELRITQDCLYTASYTPATAAFPNP